MSHCPGQGGALATLVVQNSALALVMRYTRSTGNEDKLYISTTAVVMAETLKVVVAIVMQLQVSSSSVSRCANAFALLRC